jgi:hypothetical protein
MGFKTAMKFWPVFFALLCTLPLFGQYTQDFSLSVQPFVGFAHNKNAELFYGGTGISLSYRKALGSGHLQGGIELRYLNWGSQLSLNAAYTHPYIKSKSPWSFAGTLMLQNGLALFRPKSLYAFALEYMSEISLQTKKRSAWSFGLGPRMTICPAYKDYGQIFLLWELSAKLTYRLQYQSFKK